MGKIKNQDWIVIGTYNGNINAEMAKNILLNNDIWNAFPPVISVSLKTFDYITLDREERYAGASKMSFFGLIQHALRVFSVLRVRVLIMSIIYTFNIYYMFENQYLIILLFFLMIILGGSLGNLFDRVYYRAVPDFIDLNYAGYQWFIFNVADIFITIGIICLILSELIFYKKKNEKN